MKRNNSHIKMKDMNDISKVGLPSEMSPCLVKLENSFFKILYLLNDDDKEDPTWEACQGNKYHCCDSRPKYWKYIETEEV